MIGWSIGDTRKSQLLLSTPSEFYATIIGVADFGDESDILNFRFPRVPYTI
jgi:hypothetical protein